MCSKDELQKILTKIAETAKNTFGSKFDTALLYGSYARGDYNKESDIDIMILAKVPREDLYKYKKAFTFLTSELGLEYDVVITVSLKDCETFYKYVNAVPFYGNVMKEGIPIVA